MDDAYFVSENDAPFHIVVEHKEVRPMANELTAYAKSELQRLDAERAKRIEEAGFKPFLKIEDGSTVDIDILNEEFRTNAMYPDRSIVRVRVGETEWDWSVSRNSSLYRDLMTHLAAGETKLSVTRVGLDKTDTKYSVRVRRG